jgi:hypothetical protein
MPEGIAFSATGRGPSVMPDEAEVLLTAEQVSAWTQLTEKALANARCRGTGPRYIKLGATRGAPVRYRRQDVENWLSGSIAGAA